MASKQFFRTGAAASLALAIATLVSAGTARAQDSQVTRAPEAKQPKQQPLRRYGLMLGAGVPDGATGSVVYRPFPWLRTELGGSYNMISKGVRGGVSVIPFGMGPSASLEAGHYFDGNANGVARNIAGGGFQHNAILQRIGYDFVNAHLGVDFGVKRFVFFIHGGMSYIRATIHDVNSEISNGMSSGSMGSSGGTTVSFNQDPVVRIFTPSVKMGFILYLW